MKVDNEGNPKNPYLFNFIELKYPDGCLFQVQFAHEMDVKPSLKQTLCVIGEDNKKPIPNRWGYGKEPVTIKHSIPRKPHFAYKKYFYKNPRKSLVAEFQWNPDINWEREHRLMSIIFGIYIQYRHPKIWNDPNLSIGMHTEDSSGKEEFTDLGKFHSGDFVPMSNTHH